MSILDTTNERLQGSEAWHEFRSKHVGASEIPAIMGTCDFKNIYQLWLEKTNQVEKFKGNWATRRGHEMEPIAREIYSKKTGLIVKDDVVLEFPEWPTLSASLDGFVESEKLVVEIKTPSKAKHQQALAGIVPSTYRDQLQTQMLVAGVDQADYVSYSPDDELDVAIVRVQADKQRQSEILEAAKKFWDCVTTMTPPIDVVQQDELFDLFTERERLKEQIELLETQMNQVTDLIKSNIKADKVNCHNFTATWSERKGSVDYSKIELLKTIDVEKYRKPSTRVFTIKKKSI